VRFSFPLRPSIQALILLFTTLSISVLAQSTGSLQGIVRDSSGAAISGANVHISSDATGLRRASITDGSGTYAASSLPPGTFEIIVSAPGFSEQRRAAIPVSVNRDVQINFQLATAGTNEHVEVNADTALAIESSTPTQSQTLNQRAVQDIPLNGRHFIDLFPLIAGSVTPPQSGSLSAPTRGTGASGFNSAGNREDTTNLTINGISHVDLQQNQIAFQPTVNVVNEMRVSNSTPSAEFGRSSGVMVSVATRDGGNAFHGEVYDYLRNSAMDARNFFNPRGVAQTPFKRNQFGGDFGGPLWRDHTFFFATFEGLRQRQGVTINSGVLTDAQRASATNPVVKQLLPFIPRANDTTGTAFIGSANAPVNINQWSINLSHTLTSADTLSGFYLFQTDKRNEPTLGGATVPGFGDVRYFRRQFISLVETHIFNGNIVNESRFGTSRLRPNYFPASQTNPATLGINGGITTPTGLPVIAISSIGLSIGGPTTDPQLRGDTTAVLNDTLSILHGKNYIRTGGEYRRFISSNSNGTTGSFTFATPAAFLADTANAFSVTPGFLPSRIFVNAVNAFVQDSYKASSRLTIEAGLRFEWNGTPTEGANRFVTFDPSTVSLQRVQTNGYGGLYGQQFFLEPRFGFVAGLTGDGKTVLRGGYALQAEQPITNPLVSLSANPPFASPLSFTQTTGGPATTFETAFTQASVASLAPSMTPRNFSNAYTQNFNLNLQRAITSTVTLQVGYFGSKGIHLRLTRNSNQPVFTQGGAAAGIRPYTAIAATSPYAAGRTVGKITNYDSGGMSNYNSIWITATKQTGRHLQLNTSYVYAKSLDLNSLSSQGVILQDSYNPSSNYGPSDFDARNRFVFSGIYTLPLAARPGLIGTAMGGWQLSAVGQIQSGNPFTVVTNSGVNGTAGTIRPDTIGKAGIQHTFLTNGSVQYLTPSICATATAGCAFAIPANTFGTLSRNSITGPGFQNVDLSLAKTFPVFREANLQFRADAFNVMNHPNLGQPTNQFSVTAPTSTAPGTVTVGKFGQISATRFPIGDSGSSRQLQMSLKLLF
jgi:hypothetical protein